MRMKTIEIDQYLVFDRILYYIVTSDQQLKQSETKSDFDLSYKM